MKLFTENILNPISHDAIVNMLDDVDFPEQKLKYLKSKQIITPVMRGWYLASPHIENYSNLYAANVFYGPSYISRLTALSYLGWIADRTFSYESICLHRGKEINNRLGRFIYFKQIASTFHLGVTTMQITSRLNIQIATPTKALYDYLQHDAQLNFSTVKTLENFLENELRFDMERLAALDIQLLKDLMVVGKKSRQINLLIKLITSV